MIPAGADAKQIYNTNIPASAGSAPWAVEETDFAGNPSQAAPPASLAMSSRAAMPSASSQSDVRMP
jgi:hypothetical protein